MKTLSAGLAFYKTPQCKALLLTWQQIMKHNLLALQAGGPASVITLGNALAVGHYTPNLCLHLQFTGSKGCKGITLHFQTPELEVPRCPKFQNLEPEVVFGKPKNHPTLEKSCLTFHPLGSTLHVYTCICRQTHLQWNSSGWLCNDPGLWFLKSFTIESRVFGLVCNLDH